jgi:hypothetical protein
MKLVTGIYSALERLVWEDQLRRMFSVIQPKIDLDNNIYHTRIHVSLHGEKSFSDLEMVKRVAKAAIRFE